VSDPRNNLGIHLAFHKGDFVFVMRHLTQSIVTKLLAARFPLEISSSVRANMIEVTREDVDSDVRDDLADLTVRVARPSHVGECLIGNPGIHLGNWAMRDGSYGKCGTPGNEESVSYRFPKSSAGSNPTLTATSASLISAPA
jgi:hypothetical protein